MLVYEPGSPDFPDEPYELFRTLRDDHPVFHNPGRDFWILSRHADVFAGLMDYRSFSSDIPMNLDTESGYKQLPMMIEMDPPRHDALRGLVSRAFTPRRVKELEPFVRDLAVGLVDGVAGTGGCDFVRDLAEPLPMAVIAHLLDIPNDDRETFKRWSDEMVRIDPSSPGLSEAGFKAGAELFVYFNGIIDERRAGAAGRDDLISALIEAEADGERLTQLELIGFCLLLLVAGNETTTNLVASTAVTLARHPDQRRLLAGDTSRLDGAVEEFLRYDSPTIGIGRKAARDIELHGTTIPAGASVLLLIGAANRDERAFDHPARYDVTRPPERHVAFGRGIHFCLGSALARLEARIFYEELLGRIPEWELATERVARVHSLNIRGLSTLPVTF